MPTKQITVERLSVVSAQHFAEVVRAIEAPVVLLLPVSAGWMDQWVEFRLADLSQKCALLGEDQAVVLGELEVRATLVVGPDAGTIGFVSGKVVE